MRVLPILLALPFLLGPVPAFAQEEVTFAEAQVEHIKAQVLEASPTQVRELEGLGIEEESQTLTVELLEGANKGATVTFENDFTQLAAGDVVYLRHEYGGFDAETWSVADPYRLDVLMIVAAGFLVLLLLFGGFQGVRALATLAGSIVLIFYVLLPNIHSGASPILVSLAVASLIIILGSYITHGFNWTTTTAMLGMLGTICLIGLVTYLTLNAADISGFTSEENVYLNFTAEGRIDMLGLLFGGIMIGLLGVLYDMAIGQAVAVEELIAASKEYTRRQVFLRGMRIGREHIGALVNTLAIAYVGASLPLLLLFNDTSASVGYILNSELFATEILRILIGSAGIVLAVPITTLLATYVLYDKAPTLRPSHAHSHS